MNDISDWPTEASTSDFFEKFILVIMEPALTSELVLAISPMENNCQNAMPRMAYMG